MTIRSGSELNHFQSSELFDMNDAAYMSYKKQMLVKCEDDDSLTFTHKPKGKADSML